MPLFRFFLTGPQNNAEVPYFEVLKQQNRNPFQASLG